MGNAQDILLCLYVSVTKSFKNTKKDALALSTVVLFLLVPPTLYPVTARIFIHGTILAGYFFVDIPATLKDSYKENSRIERVIAAARKHPFLHVAELILDTGLTDVTQEVMVPLGHPLQDARAAISIIRAFERTDQCIGNRDTYYHYYTFGWSGALSESKRNKESEHLYHALLNLKKELSAQYTGEVVDFEIFCHSHGGQLVAHLAQVHKLFPDQDLFIKKAVLCATPLYKEKMQPMISSPLFGTIFNIYSHGDHIQTLDCVSTPQHYCVRTLQDLEIPLAYQATPGPLVIDMSLGINGNKRVFTHDTFFSYSLYSLPSYFNGRSAIRKTINHFAPLPLIALFPLLEKNVRALKLVSGYHALCVDFMHHHHFLGLKTRYTPYGSSQERKKTDWYKIKPLSKHFIKEYRRRARKSIFNQFKYTFYHIIHS